MLALHFLKYTDNLSDEKLLLAWMEKPYRQVLSGMKRFEHEPPIDPSGMKR